MGRKRRSAVRRRAYGRRSRRPDADGGNVAQQDVEKVPSGAFSTTQAENAISVLLTKSIHYEVMIDFGRPSMGSSRLFFNSLLDNSLLSSYQSILID
ncbi:MAG: hypothetical protein M0O99_03215 [Desulfuromonas thiophila]|nr:hypothetical protein [Desulfuromonas thiophila]